MVDFSDKRLTEELKKRLNDYFNELDTEQLTTILIATVISIKEIDESVEERYSNEELMKSMAYTTLSLYIMEKLKI